MEFQEVGARFPTWLWAALVAGWLLIKATAPQSCQNCCAVKLDDFNLPTTVCQTLNNCDESARP